MIERSIGGVGGGGTKLTDYGRRLVAMFRAVEDEYQAAMDHLHREGADSNADDKAAFQRLLRRISLRTSARNQFSCAVSRIEVGAVNAQVFLALDEGCEDHERFGQAAGAGTRPGSDRTRQGASGIPAER